MKLMGRRRTVNHDMPPRLRLHHGSYFFDLGGTPRKYKNLGKDRAAAFEQWAKLYAKPAPDAGAPAEGTFAFLAARYRREVLPLLAAATQLSYAAHLTKLCGVFGHQLVADITPQHVRQWLDAKGQKHKSMANRAKGVLSTVLTYARQWGVFDGANPCQGVRRFTERARSRYVNDDEFRTVLAAADAPLAALMRLAYLTGQRPADVLKLMRSDVRDGCLSVTQNKTGTKLRIALEGELADVVAPLIGETPPKSLFLVYAKGGGPITLKALRRRFGKARAAAGVNFQFRDLRAKAATDAGNLADAQALLGHAAATTTDRYIRARSGRVVRPIGRGGK